MRSISEITRDRDAAEDRKTAIGEETRAITVRLHEESRTADAGEQERLARLERGYQKAAAEEDRFREEWREVMAVYAQDPNKIERTYDPSERSAETRDVRPGRDAAKRSIDRLFRSGSLPDYGAERATALLRTGSLYEQDLAARWAVAAGNPEYLTAFSKVIADPDHGHMLFSPKELDAFRAVHELRAGLTIAGTGQYLIPLQLDPSVILTNAGSTNAMRRISRVVQTVGPAWTGVTSAGVSAEWLATEATQVAEATPTLAPLSIPVILGDAYLHASFQAVMDVEDFQGEMTRVLLDAADRLQATAFTVGVGTTEPMGLVTALVGKHIHGKGSEAIAGTDPFDLQAALVARFSPGAVFMASLPIISAYSIMETTNGGRLFPEIGSGRLLNRPLVENSDMDSVINPAATEVNHVLAYFDPGQFIIADRIGSTLEVVSNVMGANNRPTAERGFLLWFRTGSDLATTAAGELLNVATTA
jgi:HK97 family phage major capsid protein